MGNQPKLCLPNGDALKRGSPAFPRGLQLNADREA